MASVTVQISAVNDPPVAVDDTKTVAEDSGASVVNVLVNDSDIDGPSLIGHGEDDPAARDPHARLGRPDVRARRELLRLGHVRLHGQRRQPHRHRDRRDHRHARQRRAVRGRRCRRRSPRTPGPERSRCLGNDSDVDGPSLTVTSRTDPAHGTLTLVAGVLTYTPASNYFGSDAFDYTVSDGTLADTGTVAITISPVNDDPNAVDDVATVARDAAATAVGVLGNDTDVENDPLQITGKTNGAHGTVAITGGGTGLTYDPFTGYTGSTRSPTRSATAMAAPTPRPSRSRSPAPIGPRTP